MRVDRWTRRPTMVFEGSYVPGDGAEHRVPLAQAWAVPLEQGIPVRRFRSRKGQRHLSGLWWSATTGGHVGFESWLERDSLLHLDFDPSVVGISSQPFWLHWTDAAGTTVTHAPDFFARRRDGSAVVVAVGRWSVAGLGTWRSSTRRRGPARWPGGSIGCSVRPMRS